MSTRRRGRPRAALVVGLGLLVDDDDELVLGAVALLVDALRRGLPVGVVSTVRDAWALLGRHGLDDVVDRVTWGDDVGRDRVEALHEVVADLDAEDGTTVLLSHDERLLAAGREVGLVVGEVATEGARYPSTGDVDLARHAPLASVRTELDHGVALLDGWSVSMDRHEPDQVVTVGSNLMTGNGFLGYRGTAPEWDREAAVACVVAGTYDNADGKWTELVNAPNALRVRFWLGTQALQVPHDEPLPRGWAQHRRLDLLAGRKVRDLDVGDLRLSDERFASLDELGLVAQRHRLTGPAGTRLRVRIAVDADVWDLNGPHLPEVDLSVEHGAVDDASDDAVDGVLLARGTTVQSEVDVAVAQSAVLRTGRLHDAWLERGADTLERVWDVEVVDSDGVVVDVWMAVAHSEEPLDERAPHDPGERACALARRAREDGYARLLARQVSAWRTFWDAADVEVEGDPVAQAALRFGLYHNVIATPQHDERLPVGARGLSCQAYQGAAFWDQEVYNLPPFLLTRPDVARGLLRYRVATLDGARRKAARLGFRGAFFAWISGRTGDELCPDFFFRDVLSGRWVRNHFNDWQMHVSPDVALTVERYDHVTGDRSLLLDGGAELVLEVARFLDSFVLHDHVADTFHCVRLLGPDEYHENVDDDAFTNEQTRRALDWACRVWDLLAAEHADVLDDLRQRCGFDDDERARWAHVAERLFVPRPDPETHVTEQFRGYHQLEDVRPDEVAERLVDPDEYWGWPNGVAVHTQVLKQADVVMLDVVRPDERPREHVEADVDHYLPRTQHGSSLSPGAYALVLARLGRSEEARELLLESATVDLLSRRNAAPGGTFIGGIRTAAAAMGWQVVVLGFAGLDVTDDGVRLTPRLPDGWERLSFGLQVRGVGLQVDVDAAGTRVAVVADAPHGLRVELPGVDGRPGPGGTVVSPPRG